MKKLATLLPLLASLASAHAGLVNPSATHFTTAGSVQSFAWVPESYADPRNPSTFKYDVFYYVPARLQDAANPPALVFLHGGGQSTLTEQGSHDAVQAYLPDLVRLADELGFVAVAPSANGLNWMDHTLPLLKGLNALVRQELAVDPNRIGLAGHSMGGMGIGRTHDRVADEFSFFMPMASGIDFAAIPRGEIEFKVMKEFNVPYIHLQGLQDHFAIFVTRNQEHLKQVQALEQKFGRKSKLTIEFENHDHNYDLGSFRTHLASALQLKRDLYQKELWGTLFMGNSGFKTDKETKIRYPDLPAPRYFWVEGRTDDPVVSLETVNFHAKIDGNRVAIDFQSLPMSIQRVRVNLSQSMVDLKKPIQFLVNGKEANVVASGAFEPAPDDAGYVYDQSFELAL